MSNKYRKKNIFNLITGKEFTGGIINSFLNTLKLNDANTEFICPLYFNSLNNEERITDSVKYVINRRSRMDKKYIFLPLHLTYMRFIGHW